MEEKRTFTKRFPEEIPGASTRPTIEVLIFSLLLASTYQGPLLSSLNLVIYITVVLTGLAIYDLRHSYRYFHSILLGNKEKLLNEKEFVDISEVHIEEPWGSYSSRLRWALVLILVISVAIILMFFFTGQMGAFFLVVIPLTCIGSLLMIVKDTKKVARASLYLVRRLRKSQMWSKLQPSSCKGKAKL